MTTWDSASSTSAHARGLTPGHVMTLTDKSSFLFQSENYGSHAGQPAQDCQEADEEVHPSSERPLWQAEAQLAQA